MIIILLLLIIYLYQFSQWFPTIPLGLSPRPGISIHCISIDLCLFVIKERTCSFSKSITWLWSRVAFKYRSAIGVLLCKKRFQENCPGQLWNVWSISEKPIQKKVEGDHVRGKRNKLNTHVQSLFIWAFSVWLHNTAVYTQKNSLPLPIGVLLISV